jgi:hypothetical protein
MIASRPSQRPGTGRSGLDRIVLAPAQRVAIGCRPGWQGPLQLPPGVRIPPWQSPAGRWLGHTTPAGGPAFLLARWTPLMTITMTKRRLEHKGRKLVLILPSFPSSSVRRS